MQKQRLRCSSCQVLYKKRYSINFRKIYRNTPMMQSLSNKVADLHPTTLLKRDTGSSESFGTTFCRTPPGHCIKDRSSRPKLFCERFSLKFRKIHRKIKRLWHRCFPVNFAKLPRTPFYRTPPLAASAKITLNLLTPLNTLSTEQIFLISDTDSFYNNFVEKYQINFSF